MTKSLLKYFREYLGVIVGIVFLVIIFSHNRLKDYDEDRFQPPPPLEISHLNKIKFEEVSEAYGLGGVKHNLFFPSSNPVVQKILPFMTVRPYVSVVDINKDGYLDVFFLETLPDKPSRLFLNDKGKGFIDVTNKYEILSRKGDGGTSIAAWLDVNNDGKYDFFTAEAPCFKMYLQKEDYKFEKTKTDPDYCAMPEVLNILDFNRDGNLDIGIGNYFPKEQAEDPYLSFQRVIGRAGMQSGGAENLIFLGNGKGGFKVFQPEVFARDDSKTQAFGISYINEDVWPDIFIANDYTFDAMYLNVEGQDLLDVTEQYIPRFHHGFSGMNSEFADYNLDGMLDLFVTNGWGPPSAKGENLLWEKSIDGTRFIERGKQKSVFKCGWAWGAKFADFDLDGDLDLFVSNGQARGRQAKSFKESRSVNYMRTQVRSIPTFFREDVFGDSIELMPDLTDSDFQYYGFERNCLFTQHKGKFYDVGVEAGVDDLENGRSLVTFDIENDGKIDVLIGNTDGPLLLYRNVSETEGNWIGFSLENKLGMPYHGATLFAARDDNKLLRKEVFVGNGGRGMNDPRVHFGLGPHSIAGNVVSVLWPTGEYERFKDVKINQYNKIQYGKGVK